MTRATIHRYHANGRALQHGATAIFAGLVLIQSLYGLGVTAWGFANWQPVAVGFVLWAVAYGAAQVLIRGTDGRNALFVLPAAFFTVAMAVFPTVFGLFIAFSDWNLSSLDGRKFNGIDNLTQLFGDAQYWNAMGNMVFYVGTVVEIGRAHV